MFGNEEKERASREREERKSEMKSKSPYDISLEESWPLDQIVKRLQD